MDNNGNGLAAQLQQFAPFIEGLFRRIAPVLDQPVIRVPYSMTTSSSVVIPANTRNVALVQADFTDALEFPFEIEVMKFSQDPSHTFRDWRIRMSDQTLSQEFQKTSAMVALLVDNNTGARQLRFPWVMRPKGGAEVMFVDNLDAVNPITIDVGLVGYLLVPRS